MELLGYSYRAYILCFIVILNMDMKLIERISLEICTTSFGEIVIPVLITTNYGCYGNIVLMKCSLVLYVVMMIINILTMQIRK